MGGLWKRRRGRAEYLTPAQMLETLALLRVRALLAHGAVWVAADRAVADALDACCVGALEGGPATAAWVEGLVGATRAPPCSSDAPSGGGGGGADGGAAAAAARGTDGDDDVPRGMDDDGGAAAPPPPLPPPPFLPEGPADGGDGAAGGGGGGAGAGAASRLRAVRLAPEEALFLAHVLAPSLAAYVLVEAPPCADGGPPAQTARGASVDDLWRWCCRAGAPRLPGGGGTGGGGGGDGGGRADPFAPTASAASAAAASPGTTATAAAATAPTAADPALAATEGRDGRGDGGPQAPTRPAPFAHRYAAYCHLRAKGWLPRGGLLYGADYVLYGLHPALVHSEYVAAVLPLEWRAAGGEEAAAGGAGAGPPAPPGPGAPPPPPPPPAGKKKGGWWSEAPGAAPRWVDAQIAQRLARQVFKQLLLLHVALPLCDGAGGGGGGGGGGGDDGGEALGPDGVLARGAVRETIARRWVPPAGGGVAQALADAAVLAGGAEEGPADD